jgi:signal transduction histidine kinase
MRADRLPGWVVPALLVAAGYYVAAQIGFMFTLRPQPISTLWPPNALLLAALLLAPARSWWWLLAAALPAHILAELGSGVPMAMVLGWFVSNCSEALIGASLVRLFAPGPLRLDSLRNAAVFLLCGALAAPLLSSFLDAALVRLVGWGSESYWQLVHGRFFSNVLAELTVGPLILSWAAFGPSRLRSVPIARWIEAAALLAGMVATTNFVFDHERVDAYVAPALFYVPLPFLLWAAVRFGMAGTASVLALLAAGTIWGAVHGAGPFTDRAPQEIARDLQVFLVSVAVPVLLLAVLLEERARAGREAREQRRQLEHLSRVAMLGELSGGLAHELNQPLTAILSNAQAAQHLLASKTADPQMLAEILRDIVAADQRAGEVIRRLHALFKGGETELARLDLGGVVRDVVRIVQGDFVVRSVDLDVELGEGLPAVRGDRIELQQVMLNLAMNACDAMSGEDVPQPRGLVIRAAAAGGEAVVSFVDTGPGFAAQSYERLFEPFYTTKPKGLGLGLSISSAIVRAHGGRLWGANNAGRGASVHIALPAA